MPRKRLILGSLLLAAFAINLDTTIVNVALPTLVSDLHASTTQLDSRGLDTSAAPACQSRPRCNRAIDQERKETQMRRIVWSEYISLDGVVDEPGEWSIPYFSDDLAMYKSDELLASDALLLGRVTYEGFAAAWPTMEELEGDFAVRMNTLPEYVASTTLEKADWNNSTIIRDNVPREVAKLKQESGGDILIGGSGALAKTLLEHDLIDEIRMLVHPIAVGTGKRLFEGATESIGLELVDTRSFDSGVAALTYHAGE